MTSLGRPSRWRSPRRPSGATARRRHRSGRVGPHPHPRPLAVAALLAGVLLASGLLAGCAPTLDWREWRPPGSGISVLFPCKPSTLTRQVALAGATLPLTLVACSAGGQTWAVAFADVADPARIGPALDELRRSAAANVGAGTPTELPLAVTGATPHASTVRVQLSGRLPDGKPVIEQVAVFARGTVVIQATALGERLPADAADTFFGSLRAGG